MAIGPPSLEPRSAARFEPAASMTARTSSIHSSSVGSASSGTGSETPVPPLVEAEQPTERGEAAQVTGERRLLPHHLDIVGPPRNEHQVQRTMPDDLIRDVAVLAGRVARLGLHGRQLAPAPARASTAALPTGPCSARSARHQRRVRAPSFHSW